MELCTRMVKQLLLEEVEKGNYENLVLSPLSIDVVLNMVAAGSRGRTLEKMLGLLGSKNIDEIKSQSLEMMAVAMADRYLNKGRMNRFCVWSMELGSTNAGDEVVDEINSWAEAASRGLIKDFLQRGSLSRDMVLILANGLYFKGKWEHNLEFDAKFTTNIPFYLLNGDTVSVPFMTSERYRRYRSFDGFKMGMSFPVMENPEDFAEMVEIPKGLPLFGSSMIQKACIEVDEKGTLAAAVTMMGMASCSMYRPKNTSFVADHPFMFMIMEDISKLVIFTGVVLDPSKGK
ncbi:hypothetical protein C3L33_21292, partial [Rhododendron williamsianum]